MANYTFKDETGNRYGRLLVLYPVETREPCNGCIRYMCLCDCGKYHTVAGYLLRAKRVQSCGCLRRNKHDAI